tara:strand:- start:2486 stop:2893 length:408 start_codon:yes stop_codon:yes gene_type:complete
MSWKKILKNKRPDYPDVDGDGDTTEPMVDALKTVEQVEAVRKDMKYPLGNTESEHFDIARRMTSEQLYKKFGRCKNVCVRPAYGTDRGDFCPYCEDESLNRVTPKEFDNVLQADKREWLDDWVKKHPDGWKSLKY